MEQIKNEMELNTTSPLVWAYVGDAVYELYVRKHLVKNTKLNPHKLHIETIKYVKAGAQANILEKIKPELTEDELEIVRRARNTENHHLPKSADVMEYRLATALEGLIGYLYLNGQEQRLKDILKMCIEEI
ncbi:MAG: Mini-ribonuclease 3 [Clostridia bacterium]|nr:Mini-ribonuclease 3 [Clostridia bacterium]